MERKPIIEVYAPVERPDKDLLLRTFRPDAGPAGVQVPPPPPTGGSGVQNSPKASGKE